MLNSISGKRLKEGNVQPTSCEIADFFKLDSPNLKTPSWVRCSWGPGVPIIVLSFGPMVSSSGGGIFFRFLGRPFCWVVVGKYGEWRIDVLEGSLEKLKFKIQLQIEFLLITYNGKSAS